MFCPQNTSSSTPSSDHIISLFFPPPFILFTNPPPIFYFANPPFLPNYSLPDKKHTKDKIAAHCYIVKNQQRKNKQKTAHTHTHTKQNKTKAKHTQKQEKKKKNNNNKRNKKKEETKKKKKNLQSNSMLFQTLGTASTNLLPPA